MFVPAAYFDIERASSYLNANNFFVQDGRATYEGIELSIAGELTSNLSVLASALYNDAIQESGAATVAGKRIENAPKYSGSLFVKYCADHRRLGTDGRRIPHWEARSERRKQRICARLHHL